TGFLQSEIDACCLGLESQIEILETCCDQLRTSTGFLQSQIDAILCPVDCCDVRLLTNVNEPNNILTADWSYDNRFVAIGLANQTDPNILKIYELVGSSLILRAQTTVGTTAGDITSVRWN